MYVVFGGNDDCGRIDGVTERIVPVTGETVIVAGERMRVFCGVVMAARVDTRTVRGWLLKSGGVEEGVG